MSWLRRWLRGERRAPRDVDTVVRKALRCVLEGDLDGAEELLSRAVQIDSDQVDAYLSLARLYRLRGEIARGGLRRGLLRWLRLRPRAAGGGTA